MYGVVEQNDSCVPPVNQSSTFRYNDHVSVRSAHLSSYLYNGLGGVRLAFR